jgi:HAD superfamily hydrolase (TIGR01509 family)
MRLCSHAGSAAYLQPRQQSLHMRHQKQRLPPSHAAVVCTLRNFDWPEALLWDCDGVLCDTERDGHRLAFNEAFKQKGLPHVWSVEKYGELLSTGGGKERMTRYFKEVEDQEPFKSMKDEGERKALVAELHRLKTDIFMDMVQRGTMPLRPGVQRLVREAIDAGVKVAVCSTSNERAVQAIVDVLLGADVSKQMPVFAGDMVPAKKPDPAIYLMAAKELGVDPARCVVIEDSHIGVRAARAAGMRCVVTQSSYTADEDFSLADAVFECIGDAGDEQFSLHDLTTPGSFWVNAPYPVDKDGNRTGGGGGDAESAVDLQSESATLSR